MNDEVEEKLLKYISLVDKYHYESPAIPVACFDTLMSRANINNKCHWEFSLSPPLKILLLEMIKHTLGCVKALKVAHPLLAGEILHQILGKRKQRLSEMMNELLECKIFQTKISNSRKDLYEITSDLSMRRRKYEYGDGMHTQFPPFFEDVIKDEGTDQAVEILKKAFILSESEMYNPDAFLAQHIAHVLYLQQKNFKEVHIFAEKAINIQQNSSTTLDTKGQVYKEKLVHRYHQYINDKKALPPNEWKEALKIASKAVDLFRKSQDVNKKKEKCNINLICYLGELHVNITILQLLMSSEKLFDKDVVYKFFLEQNFSSESLDSAFCGYSPFVRNILDRSQEVISELYSNVTITKQEEFYEQNKNSYQNTFLHCINDCFAKFSDFMEYLERNVVIQNLCSDAVCAFNRWKMKKMGVTHFYHVMKLEKTKLEGMRKSLKNLEHPIYFDFCALLMIHVALAWNVKNKKNCTSQIFKKTIELCEKLINVPRSSSFFECFFAFMFLWPRERMKVPYNHNNFKNS
ncbi:uncharacterized protein LOC143254432 [Tachypleus tridentatus]|uniref:uncharacterized protein LOC143254432 n=1 Tax=Tachypleus tridentatus TaxID=6853 RepID=UPI003FCF30FC